MPALAADSMPPADAAQEKAAKPAEASKAADVKLVEVVPDLPDFPNAVMASSKEKGPSDGWTHTWERETRTTASFDDVEEFYLEQVEQEGVENHVQPKEKPGKAEWALSKGAELGAREARRRLGRPRQDHRRVEDAVRPRRRAWACSRPSS